VSGKIRFALLFVMVLLAVPAATANAVARMPVGFFDDPSFRWEANPLANLKAAQQAHTSVIHVLADWATIAPTRPASPLNGNDKAYVLSDLDALVESAQKYDFQVLLTISGTPPWANGGQTPNHPPTNTADLTQFAQMLASRYNGSHAGKGTVSLFSVWNEPNLQEFLTPQFEGNTIVSPGIYSKLYQAAYKGIKAGNPKALVAIGETSNRGRNHPSGGGNDSVAPATFAHLLSLAAPKIQFAAWATHPYPEGSDRLGPTQKVAYPNVAFSTMTRFGSDLKTWFHRRVPIWITEYAEQTVPEHVGGVTYSQQASDVKQVLKLAAANPYVEMFVWFVFRDSTPQTWFSGLETAKGAKKASYSAFAATAQGIEGQSQVISPGQPFVVNVPVPVLTYFDPPGYPVTAIYKVYLGASLVAAKQVSVTVQTDARVSIPVNFKPVKGKSYAMNVFVADKHGNVAKTTYVLLPPT
jgi:hypothetical protein